MLPSEAGDPVDFTLALSDNELTLEASCVSTGGNQALAHVEARFTAPGPTRVTATVEHGWVSAGIEFAVAGVGVQGSGPFTPDSVAHYEVGSGLVTDDRSFAPIDLSAGAAFDWLLEAVCGSGAMGGGRAAIVTFTPLP